MWQNSSRLKFCHIQTKIYDSSNNKEEFKR